jgi:hypothetical protein
VIEDFRHILERELDAAKPPPIGRIAPDVMRQGRQMRRRRDLTIAGSAAAVLTVALAVAALGGPPAAETPAEVAASLPAASPAPPVVSAPPTTAGPSPARPTVKPSATCGKPAVPRCAPPRQSYVFPSPGVSPGVPKQRATAKGGLQLLTQVIPAGVQAGFGYTDGADRYTVRVTLDRGGGPAEVAVTVAARSGPAPLCTDVETCYNLPGRGQVAVTHDETDCRRRSLVELRRVDGITISARLPDCRPAPRGSGTVPVTPAMTDQEAINILLDHRWGLELPAEVEALAAVRFADLEPRQETG